MYGTNSVVNAVLLILLILLANEIAYRVARRTAAAQPGPGRPEQHVGAPDADRPGICPLTGP